MAPRTKILILFLAVLPLLFLAVPGQGNDQGALDIFYSNDLGGQTEPCG
jgi:hypothetical protein